MKTVNKQTNHQRGRGSALVWILVWLLGVAGIAWTGLNYAVPKFERKLQIAVEESITAFNADSLSVDAIGRDITLAGEVASENDKSLLLAAANSTPGVGEVRSEITIVPTINTDSVEPTDAPAESSVQVATAEILPIDNTPKVDIVEPADEPIDETPTPTPTPTETLPVVEDKQVASDNSTLLALNDSASATNIATQKPNISIRVFGNILSIEGNVAKSDDTTGLVQNALSSFNRDIVSNDLRQKDNVQNARWLTALTKIMPLMESMGDAQIGITDQQMTLSGIAPNRTVHDAVVKEALKSMGYLSLVEKIKIANESDGSENNTETVIAATEPSDEEIAAKEREAARLQAVAAAEAADEAKKAAAKARADEQARLAAQAAEKAKAEEQARLAAEAAAKARADEEARLAAEAAEKAKAEEQARLAAEAAAKARADEEARLAAEAAQKAKAEQQARLAAEAAAKARADEEARLAAEAAQKAKAEQQARLAAEADEKARADEAARVAAEAAKKAAQREDVQTAMSELPSMRILFDSEGNSLTAASYDVLDQVADVLLDYPDTEVIVEGYTDATGDPRRNMDLSLLRATTVRDYLIQRGVSIYNVRAIGLGAANPLVSNATPEGRAINRRIEFTFR